MKDIKVSELIFERLQKLATPLVDTSESVIERLLDHYEPVGPKDRPMPSISIDHKINALNPDRLQRQPRQRGIIVKLGDEKIVASSVSELYVKVLKFLHEKGVFDKAKAYIPLATSQKRYLIAASPVHPNGKKFVVPVKYNGYYMEAHKDYKNGIQHLSKLTSLCGVKLTYIE